MRQANSTPTPLTPTAPPNWRKKFMVLAPAAMRGGSSTRIALRLSDGITQPRPMRPSTAHKVSQAIAVAAPTPTISANEVVITSRPMVRVR